MATLTYCFYHKYDESFHLLPRIQYPDYERVTSLKHLHLSSEGLHSGQRGYVVEASSYSYGEDITPR